MMAALIVPSVSFANNLSDLEAKRIDLMKQLVALLEVKVQQLQLLIAERRGVDPQVLGLATSTPNVSASVEEVREKKRRRGGGGGSSRSNDDNNNSNDPVVEDTTEETDTATTTPEIDDPTGESATSTATSTDDGLGEDSTDAENDTNKKLTLSTTTVTTKSDVIGSDDELGHFEIEFTLTAEEEDFYISNFIGNNASGTSRGVAYSIDGPEGFEVDSTNLFYLDGESGEITEDVFKIEEGTSKRFGLRVIFTTNKVGQYRVALEEINYTKVPDGVSNIETIIPTPESLFKTSYQPVNSSDISNPDDETTDDTVPAEEVDSFLKLGLSSNNPDSYAIHVDDLVDTVDNHLLSFNIEAEDGSFDIDQLAVGVETSLGDLGKIVDEVDLVIDGVTYHAEPFVSGGSELVDSEKAVYVFNVEGLDLLVADEKYEVKVLVDINGSEGNFDTGQLIRAIVTSQEKDAWVVKEGEDFVSQDELTGSATGDQHTLVSKGIIIPVDSFDSSVQLLGENDTIGIFEIEFDVTAIEGDFYIKELAAEGVSAISGVEFTVDGPNGFSVTPTAVIFSTADEDQTGVFTVREGQTETFTLSVMIDPDISGQYRVTLGDVNYSTDPDGISDAKSYTPVPVQDFRTSYESINSD